MKLTAEDIAVLGMLTGATFGPDSVLRLPSGIRVIGPEITNLINWVAKLPMDYDERKIGVEQQTMSEWKPIGTGDKESLVFWAPKGTKEPDWNKLADGPLARPKSLCYLAARREDHSPHNWSRAGIPSHCPGFVEDLVRDRNCPTVSEERPHPAHNWTGDGVPALCPGYFVAEWESEEPREGDQPLPTPNDRPDIQSLVLEDIRERRNVGIQRYGTPLQAHNGRDALRDAYEEALDLVMYLRQMMEEREQLDTRVGNNGEVDMSGNDG